MNSIPERLLEPDEAVIEALRLCGYAQGYRASVSEFNSQAVAAEAMYGGLTVSVLERLAKAPGLDRAKAAPAQRLAVLVDALNGRRWGRAAETLAVLEDAPAGRRYGKWINGKRYALPLPAVDWHRVCQGLGFPEGEGLMVRP